MRKPGQGIVKSSPNNAMCKAKTTKTSKKTKKKSTGSS
jgi:hypothetical protein